jgi:hypothetical protein
MKIFQILDHLRVELEDYSLAEYPNYDQRVEMVEIGFILVSNVDKPPSVPSLRPTGSSNANSNPVPVMPRPAPPVTAPRNSPAITKPPSNPPPVAQRTNPNPPPVSSRPTPPIASRSSLQPPQTQRKPSFTISPQISPRSSVAGIPLTKPKPGSPRGSGSSLNSNSKTLQDGKWTFSADIPVPRSFPSGEIQQNYATKKMPPPPPNRSSTSKKPAPAPPQRH